MSRLSARGDVLFPLGEDIGETNNLIDEHPEKAEPLRKKKAAFEAEFRISRRSVGVGETDGGTPAVAEIQEAAEADDWKIATVVAEVVWSCPFTHVKSETPGDNRFVQKTYGATDPVFE